MVGFVNDGVFNVWGLHGVRIVWEETLAFSLSSWAGRECGYSTPALSHLLSRHAEGNKLASADGTMAALRGGQSDPFERLNAAFDGRPWPARAASQVLLNAQPVLRVGVAQIGRFRQTRQGFRLVTGHSPALSIQRRQVDLRPAVPVRLLHSAVSTDDVPSMGEVSPGMFRREGSR